MFDGNFGPHRVNILRSKNNKDNFRIKHRLKLQYTLLTSCDEKNLVVPH